MNDQRRGHILVTTRLFEMESGADGDSGGGSLLLGCFSPNESMELLCRAAGSRNMEGETNTSAARQVCERLGHLPLALGMAAAYMHRCDVDCVEYLGRYTVSESSGQSLLRHGKLQDYALSVSSSLSLSLVAIEKESSEAYGILRALCFLGPDQITKPLLRHLLSSTHRIRSNDLKKVHDKELQKRRLELVGGSILLSSMVGLTTLLVTRTRYNATTRLGLIAFTTLLAGTTSAVTFVVRRKLPSEQSGAESSTKERINRKLLFAFSADEYEQADSVWDILKSYSLLTVKDGKGSMHRLLAEALRYSQSDLEWQFNLRICLDAIKSIWTFKADQTSTWKGSLHVLEHVKSVVSHFQSCSVDSIELLKAAKLSKEAGVFSAMALNAFIEAQQSFEWSIAILVSANNTKKPQFEKARADSLHELGRVFRYQGKYVESEQSLMGALHLYENLTTRDVEAKQGVADTLHELGVLEAKKHNLDSATKFLQESLKMRYSINEEYAELSNANSAASLHQLAAICVAKKPPSLEKAKSLLKEALGLSRQIGERAATLKQLARVTIRQGSLDQAESFLEQALDLYIELYGDNKNHINIAGVKFQQGALALQREQWEQAWLHFSECLRIRKSVYAYARPVCDDEADAFPTHLEVSCVLHELARVASSQGYYSQALETLKSERIILQRLEEASDHHNERIYQARLTNLTWLRKCAKEMTDEDSAAGYSNERTELKKAAAARTHEEQTKQCEVSESSSLSEEAVRCRLAARKYALEKDRDGSKREDLNHCISKLSQESRDAASGPIKVAAGHFMGVVIEWMDNSPTTRRAPILQACDVFRYVFKRSATSF
jgi:tetratricopeptide (TPR) repeat protein